ncbi:ABC transporter permease [Ktedonosporobacter rubrisoli]|uniref:ABC transporter permease n=1 Tax=Ktedonosporobacter rubrisoli TaxID=2509675 RepID=A0A4V0YYQ7_KTERU|nr:ABC transporter permease [Ktedonosporobacter rubrisoli]QBD77061.1 ABC transporter permease [Ktedonosporobacter rubrisoli]
MRQLLRRIGFYLVALWVSITINFLIPHLAPGNPAQAFIARMKGKVTPQTQHALEIALGVNHDPLWLQYFQYLGNLLHGNLGVSITYLPTPVTEVIAQDLPWTLVLVGVSLIISFLIGTILGIIVVWRRGSLSDVIGTPFFTFLSAIPYFWLALVLLYFLGFQWGWFPIHGGYDSDMVDMGWNIDFILSAAQYAILPALTIVIGSIAGWMLGMRNAMITTLAEDFVLMAEAKGLRTWRVMYSYAARNAILPNVTAFALSLGFVVSGSLLTEIVFSYPGIGFATIQAIDSHDYALLQGIFLVLTLAVLGANFFADLLYIVLDPRVRAGGN